VTGEAPHWIATACGLAMTVMGEVEDVARQQLRHRPGLRP